MVGYTAADIARRAGVGTDFVDRLIELGLLRPDEAMRLDEVAARRAACLHALTRTGVPLEAFVEAEASGATQLDFLNDPVYSRFAAVSEETFAQLSARTGISENLLSAIREALGSPPPRPDDYVREFELAVMPFAETSLRVGFTEASVERHIRSMGDNLRRIAETESENWYTTLIKPSLSAGEDPAALAPDDESYRLADLGDQAIIAVLHGQQSQAWLLNVLRAVGGQLDRAGLHEETVRHPAICFIDVTGYTRLTQEQGGVAAADVAERLARIVQRTSVARGGKPIKWLGDGVMLYFEAPRDAVAAALEMLVALKEAGLPSAHVGIDAGEVLRQQGDYFGQTVNLAARISDYARQGEVLISQAVVDAGLPTELQVTEIGPVELKGVTAPVVLYAVKQSREGASA